MGRKGQNTLVILIQSFEGKTLTLELRNDVEVTGEIETVDEQMKSVFLIVFFFFFDEY